jgi:hypothetical protein
VFSVADFVIDSVRKLLDTLSCPKQVVARDRQCISEITHSLRSESKKIKLSLCLTKHHAKKTYWGSAVIAPRILEGDKTNKQVQM